MGIHRSHNNRGFANISFTGAGAKDRCAILERVIFVYRIGYITVLTVDCKIILIDNDTAS